MPVSRDWEAFVLEQLSALGRVRARRMFGGLGLWLDETFFGLVAGAAGDVYFKVDDGNRPDYEAAGSTPFRPFADKAYAMSVWRVPPEVIDDPDDLVSWARNAIAAARRSAMASRRAKPRTTRTTAAQGTLTAKDTPRARRPKPG